MSSSRSSRRRSRRSPAAPGAAAARAEEQQVVAAPADDGDGELVSRLRALLPRDAAANNNGKAAAKASRARVLREACVHIRRLHAEVDDAADRLARMLEDHPSAAAVDGTDALLLLHAELIRNLPM